LRSGRSRFIAAVLTRQIGSEPAKSARLRQNKIARYRVLMLLEAVVPKTPVLGSGRAVNVSHSSQKYATGWRAESFLPSAGGIHGR
jgi:hypothetical protein